MKFSLWRRLIASAKILIMNNMKWLLVVVVKRRHDHENGLLQRNLKAVAYTTHKKSEESTDANVMALDFITFSSQV